MEDIGIYTNIRESGRKDKYGNKIYYATCRVCGTEIEKKLSNIKRSNKLCRHNSNLSDTNDCNNDMPTGWVNVSSLNKRIYDIWKKMLFRTTQKCWDENPTYNGTTVDDSWRTLSIFVNDIKCLPGYNEWINSPKRSMMLDKDTLIEGNKHYSKETCCFISALESSIDVNKRHPNNTAKAIAAFVEKYSIPVKITNKETGEEKIFTSLSDACRVMGWSRGNAYQVLSNDYSGHHSIKGWEIVRI